MLKVRIFLGRIEVVNITVLFSFFCFKLDNEDWMDTYLLDKFNKLDAFLDKFIYNVNTTFLIKNAG